MALLGFLSFCSHSNAQLPRVESLEAQPLQSQIQRLQDALRYLGAPLPQAARETLEQAQAATDNARVVSLIQDALDPLCAATVIIGRQGKTTALAAGQPVELQEQGWRTHLIKVLNRAEQPASLRVSSPNAGRSHLDVRIALHLLPKQAFRHGTSTDVAGANEQYFRHGCASALKVKTGWKIVNGNP